MSRDRHIGPPLSSQVAGHGSIRAVTVCKTVGLAYVGSNPTPATIKLAGQTRSRGPGLMRCGSGLGTAPRAGHLGYGPYLGWSGRLIFRTSPGHLYSTRRDYTHAVIEFGRAPALEVHVGVKVQGSSGVEHECDVLVLNAAEAVLSRRLRTSPRAGKCLIAIECKYYTAHLPLGQARGFAGLSADLGNAAHAIFVANIGSESVTKYLNGRKVPRELNVISGARRSRASRALSGRPSSFMWAAETLA
jgi:hypothetical protein